MITRVAYAVLLLLLAGCAHSPLPYRPEAQPEGARLSAGYQILADRLRVEVDTDGRRLEDVWIARSDGSAVRAQTIENAPTVIGPGPSVSVGVGGGTWGGRGGVGTGVGIGIPVGGGASRIEGHTFVSFPLDQVGPPPWRMHVKVAGAAPATIVLGGAD